MDVRVGLWRRLTPKNWCFWTVVFEKTLGSPLDCKEFQPVHSEGDPPWDFFRRNDTKTETPVLWPPLTKSWLIGKDSDAGSDWRQEEKEMTEDKMAGWHHWLNGCESEWTPAVGDAQGGLACCDSWGPKELDTTEWLNWTELRRSKKESILPGSCPGWIHGYPLGDGVSKWGTEWENYREREKERMLQLGK